MSSSWSTLLGDVALQPGETLLYLDGSGLDSLAGPAVLTVADRWTLRRILEQTILRQRPDAAPVLVHVIIPGLCTADDLPPDARALPLLTLNLRLPTEALAEVAELPVPAVRALIGDRPLNDRLAALARELTGLAWPPPPDTALLSVVRLVEHAGPALRALLAPTCPPGLAAAVLSGPDPTEVLSALLDDWGARGGAHPHDAELRTVTEEFLGLLERRLLRTPKRVVADLPIGLRLYRPEETGLSASEKLLAELPSAATSYSDWLTVADAWARLRWSIAALPPTEGTAVLAASAWARWAELDVGWSSWLQSNYAVLLSGSVMRPASVHRVAPFLAAASVNTGSKVMLLVLDGLGIGQWLHIVKALNLRVADDRRVLACLPTITTVSRQSIFAGALPTSFPDTLERTDTEASRWNTFWRAEGLDAADIHYDRIYGHEASEWVDPPAGAVAVGLAVNAVDDLMHGASVNADHQFHAGVTTWLRSGFLERALDWARRNEMQVWVTSDHGNLPCLGMDSPIPNEGVRVTGRGQRVRTYRSELLRDATQLPGLPWTPPGFPASAGAPLFAFGRTCFRRGGVTVTHGGLSQDEVIVPLVRVEP
ncbi:PglZ domain-containing protein [Cellulomonas chengniuliangii]|uniref:PglZ domain-containing protein n=1 Tax=Cellulomonas chengniuliangii TaxID=2968084 RepID=A0ABY5KXN3_9CELL|nr:PglZ domain-containing protein [Cellulomonas chengniuliangii]MCC2309166.1 PglZ domain-containing protein [Cellulomonas chengniuliangii]UUI75252.1 PglZ domain-containing protein [Cellulomonas chengniuliangii]